MTTLFEPVAGRMFPWPTIADLVNDELRDMAPDAGIEIAGTFLSFQEIKAQARRIAANLRMAGLQKGDRVASLLGNQIEVVLTWFGTVLAGGIWAPLNVSLVRDDLAYTLRKVGPFVVVTDLDGLHKFVPSIVAGELPELKFVVGKPEEAGAGFCSFAELLAEPSSEVTETEVLWSDPAVIIFTGGSTGLPRGVLLPHFACLAGGYRYVEALSARSQDRHYATSTLFHAGGLFIAVLGPMIAGMRTTIDRHFSASAYWRRVRESRATLINPPGVTLTMLCKQPAGSEDKNHKVRAGLGITGQLPPQIPSEFTSRFGIPLINLYSLSEASGALTVYNPLDSPKPDASGTGGRWAEIAITNERGELLGPGQLGEIMLRPRVPYTFMLGYHGDAEATVKAFANLWLNTGDMGYLDEEGYLFFKGREAHWIRRRGENISAYEVEALLQQYPGISEVVVVGVPSELGEEEVKAFIVRASEQPINPQDLTMWCLDRIAAYKLPRFIEFIEAFPKVAAKPEVDRTALKARTNEGAWDREAVFGRRIPRRGA